MCDNVTSPLPIYNAHFLVSWVGCAGFQSEEFTYTNCSASNPSKERYICLKEEMKNRFILFVWCMNVCCLIQTCCTKTGKMRCDILYRRTNLLHHHHHHHNPLSYVVITCVEHNQHHHHNHNIISYPMLQFIHSPSSLIPTYKVCFSFAYANENVCPRRLAPSQNITNEECVSCLPSSFTIRYSLCRDKVCCTTSMQVRIIHLSQIHKSGCSNDDFASHIMVHSITNIVASFQFLNYAMRKSVLYHGWTHLRWSFFPSQVGFAQQLIVLLFPTWNSYKPFQTLPFL